MPKLNGTHIVERLRKRIVELEAGEEVAAKDIRVLLTDEQNSALDAAWDEQAKLREGKRVRIDAERQAQGIKSKRELRIAAFKSALEQAEDNEIAAWDAKLRAAEVRQARVYFDALNAAKASGKDKWAAENWANNELTRAGLRRLDGQDVRYLSKRDKEVNEMEDALRAKMRENLTAEELEQLVLSEQHDEATANRRRLKK
jgi:hypothetical protein